MIAEVGVIYQHYKGHQYKVLAIAKHSENLSEMVVYQDITDEANVWVRPRKMFEELLEKKGGVINRFKKIS